MKRKKDANFLLFSFFFKFILGRKLEWTNCSQSLETLPEFWEFRNSVRRLIIFRFLELEFLKFVEFILIVLVYLDSYNLL